MLPHSRAVSDPDWKVLADAAKARRHQLSLSRRAVLARGGPCGETVRQLEIGLRTNYRSSTYGQLDTGLGWPLGTAQAVLHGSATLADALAFPSDARAAAVPPADPDPDRPRDQVIPALSQAAAELSRLLTPTPAQEQALSHVLEALNLVRVPPPATPDNDWP